MRLVTSQDMRRIEAAADAAGLPYAEMMQSAGTSVARAVAAVVAAGAAVEKGKKDANRREAAASHDVVVPDLPSATIIALVGRGNNGGDGLVAAAQLAEAGHDVRVLMWRRRAVDDPLVAALAAHPGVPVVPVERSDGLAMLRAWLAEADIVIDALLGTGASRPIEGAMAEILDALAVAAAGPDGPLIVAVDLPTGLHADDGSVDPRTVAADITVTFGFPKVGQLRFPGAAMVGELVIDGIGIPQALGLAAGSGWWEAPAAGMRGPMQSLDLASPQPIDLASPQPIDLASPRPVAQRPPRVNLPPLAISTAAEVAACLPPRPLDAHKGSFGRVLVIAGSVNYTGAAYLAAAAAYRAGAGLVTLALPASLQPIIASLLPEATFLPLPEDRGVLAPAAAGEARAVWAGYDAVLLGPGLTTQPSAAAFVETLLGRPNRDPSVRLERQTGSGESAPSLPRRLVVDADGLNLVARLPGGPMGLPSAGGGPAGPAERPSACVLTPHPGEMARLTGRSAAEINADREGIARAAAADWGHVVVLKGAFSVIAAPDGRVVVNPFASPALATAGTGDILAGLVTGLLAQGMAPFEAAVAAAHVHGLAGKLAGEAIGSRGALAGDVLARVAEAWRVVEEA